VDNSVNGATFGENHYGSAIQDSNFIYIEIGHGVGGGIVIDGQLYRGSRGFAGEIGYMTILCESNDENLSAKSWQSLVNKTTYMSIARHRIFEGADSNLGHQSLTFERLIDALHDGDEVAVYGMREMCKYLGLGIASLVNIFDITVFILGGELGKEFGPFLPHLHDAIDRQTVIKPPNGIDLRISELMPDAALMGAVAQVFDDTLREPALNVGP
jgi:predicted NBD/HSP70 family sugar kinase